MLSRYYARVPPERFAQVSRRGALGNGLLAS